MFLGLFSTSCKSWSQASPSHFQTSGCKQPASPVPWFCPKPASCGVTTLSLGQPESQVGAGVLRASPQGLPHRTPYSFWALPHQPKSKGSVWAQAYCKWPPPPQIMLIRTMESSSQAQKRASQLHTAIKIREACKGAATWRNWWAHFPLRTELGDGCWLWFETPSPEGWMSTSLFSQHKHHLCLISGVSLGWAKFYTLHGGGIKLQPQLSGDGDQIQISEPGPQWGVDSGY